MCLRVCLVYVKGIADAGSVGETKDASPDCMRRGSLRRSFRLRCFIGVIISDVGLDAGYSNVQRE